MIYLDNAATTRVCEEAAQAALSRMRDDYFNPSAGYRQALDVELSMRNARQLLTRATGASGYGVAFTSGGTESAALAISAAKALVKRRHKVLVSAIEHPAVMKNALALEAAGCEVQTFPVDGRGIVMLDALAAHLDEKTSLVCLMHVSNEVGAVQPLAEAARIAHSKGALVFVDGAQGFMRCPVSLSAAGIDLYSVSGHKIRAPKGIGALVYKNGIRLLPVMPGGGQEDGLRSGTHNTPGIAALAAAVEVMERLNSNLLAEMKLKLWNEISSRIPEAVALGPAPDSSDAAPHILCVAFPNLKGEAVQHALEADGVLVGTGAACSTKKRGISDTLAAMDVPVSVAEGSIRLSVGYENTMEEMLTAAEAIHRAVGSIRAAR